MDDKHKHLEFAQGVITRMGQNSFLIKGWSVTLVSALVALSAKDVNHKFIVIAYFPTIIFWLLDGYFLYQERLFRKLYDNIRKQITIDFSFDITAFDNGILDWASALVSKTIILFYGVIIGTLIIAMKYLN